MEWGNTPSGRVGPALPLYPKGFPDDGSQLFRLCISHSPCSVYRVYEFLTGWCFPLSSPALLRSTTFTPVLRSSWTSRTKLPLAWKMILAPPSSPTSTLGIGIRYSGNSNSDMCKCAPSSFLSLLAHSDTRKGLP